MRLNDIVLGVLLGSIGMAMAADVRAPYMNGAPFTSGHVVVATSDGLGIQDGGAASGAALNGNNVWTAGQAVTPAVLTPGAGTIAVNASLSNNFTLTIGNNTNVLGNPTGVIAGQHLTFALTLGGAFTGFSTGTNYKFAGGTAPTWSTASGKVDLLSCFAASTTVLDCSAAIDVR